MRWDVVIWTAFGVGCLVALVTIGIDAFAEGEKKGFERGWIAGIDYEKHRREPDDAQA